MDKVVNLRERLESDRKRKQAEQYRGKMRSIQKLVQCASCHMRCVMCGLHLDPAEATYKTAPKPGFTFCETCSEEFEDYLAQSKGEGDPGRPYWHNEEWEKMWTAWLDYQRTLHRFVSSHEYKLILKELHTQL
ncbi:MAG: hypothetical protein JRJ65_18700 [Deltaproteobacteria bacterium]|nr:hypothetical protein [Deltaproteobacteria bacterium]